MVFTFFSILFKKSCSDFVLNYIFVIYKFNLSLFIIFYLSSFVMEFLRLKFFYILSFSFICFSTLIYNLFYLLLIAFGVSCTYI